MSTSEDGFVFVGDHRRDLDRLPDYDLDYLYDNRLNPREVTLIPKAPTRDEGWLTEWLTADVDHAVSLEAVR